jgi:hypothetical protein
VSSPRCIDSVIPREFPASLTNDMIDPPSKRVRLTHGRQQGRELFLSYGVPEAKPHARPATESQSDGLLETTSWTEIQEAGDRMLIAILFRGSPHAH